MSFNSGYKDFSHWGDINYEPEYECNEEELLEIKIKSDLEKQRNLEKIKLSKSRYLQSLNKFTYSMHTGKEIIDSVIRKLVKELSTEAVIRYCKYEKLPLVICELVFTKKVMCNLIKQHLIAQSYSFDENTDKNLNNLLDFIFENTACRSVYERVGDIQIFINNSIVPFSVGAPDKELMRQILSICRLAIGVIEFNTRERSYLIEQLLSNKKLDSIEKALILPDFNGKRFIKNWKIRHIKSFAFFFSEKGRVSFSRLLKLDPNIEISDLKLRIVDIFFDEDEGK